MTDLRPIDPKAFADRLPPLNPIGGEKPELAWIEIARLRVDRSYQRGIHERGVTNLRRIAVEFDWSKFAPVIVAAVGGGHVRHH